jgi:uncharacterized membrane protein
MRMSDRVAGRSIGTGLAGRVALVLGLLAVAAGPAAPLAGAVEGLEVTTPFPAVVVESGSTASFKLAIDVNTARRVDLAATGVPSGWTARFRGGGLVVDGVFVDPGDVPEVTLDIEVPDGAPAGASTITVRATSGSLADSLSLSLRVADAAAGDVTLTTDFPELRGPSTTEFSFNVTLHNDTAAEATFSMQASGEAGWTVSAEPAGQAQATSTTVGANGTASITVTARPPASIAAGTFPVTLAVSGAGKNATVELQVVVTGTYTMVVSTPDEVLSTTANAGTQKDLELTVSNTGTAPITGLALTSVPPTNWTVTFDPATVEVLEPGKTGTVLAHITPTTDAIGGDYVMSITATGAEATGSTQIRVRVETPQFWWIVGVVLIGLTFAGLYWVFRTYGRR